MADDLGTIDTSGASAQSNLINMTALNQDALREQSEERAVGSELAATDPAAAASTTATDTTGIDPRTGFKVPEPQDHFNDIMKQAPLLMALAAVGGGFVRGHGLNMLATTNAMMKGIVQGSDAAYKEAREKFDRQYDDYQTRSKTWWDVYKAYLGAYKGRADVNQRAQAAADRAVGVTGQLVQRAKAEVDKIPDLNIKLAEAKSRIDRRTHQNATDDIRAAQGKERVEIARQTAKVKEGELAQRIKTADTNTLSAEARTLNEQRTALLRQYPASKGSVPPEVQVKLDSYQKQLDLIAEKLHEHTQANFQQNEIVYGQARAALAQGADRAKVVERLVQAGLDPSKL